MSKANLQLAIYISAIMLTVGVFSPLASIPVYGEITYYKIDVISSYIIIVCALLAPVVIIIDRGKLAALSSCGIWLTLLYPAIKDKLIQKDEVGFLDKLVDKAKDPLQDFAIDLFLNITEFMWGGYMFVTGLCLFTFSSVLLLFKSK